MAVRARRQLEEVGAGRLGGRVFDSTKQSTKYVNSQLYCFSIVFQQHFIYSLCISPLFTGSSSI
jgi:hypothetical protein